MDVRGATAKLWKVLDERSQTACYVLRDAAGDGPFYGPSTHLGILSMDAPVPFSELDAEEIRQEVARRFGGGEDSTTRQG